ncbi:MAG: hypothetical protein JNL97_00780, partial [Verrucomicrobiales bacterium]|nr:hypothetical protein [Verrucomicrobiales bacterium]
MIPFRSPSGRRVVPVSAWASLAATVFVTSSGWSQTPPTGPRTPADERASFVLADAELRVELVAAEPEVTSPVALAWDADGALFVAEMNDYPTAPEGGRIRRLLDRDGDGRYETSTVFADGLHFPSSVQPWRDGLLVSAAPQVVFLRDRDGDGKADERRVVLSGFAEGNQQLRVNALTWRPDNWVYGANGRSDGDVIADGAKSPVSLRRHDFRFRPDTGEIETLAGPSQFGMGFDAVGNRFLSWNTIPVRHEVIPERYVVRARGASAETLQDCLESRDAGHVYPLAAVPRTFNRESTRHFNALAGLHVFDGDGLGPSYRGSAFVGETLRSLVHRRVLEPGGATFVARRGDGEQTREFLAASDPWFHPVNFAAGPDGALYVCDFYRRWVEHPGFVPESLRSQHDWREGWNHGRIWRVVSKHRPPASGTSPSGDRTGNLSRLGEAEWVRLLGHSNVWQRLTAQRLLAERGSAAAAERTKARTSPGSGASGLERWHALWALENLGRLDRPALLAALEDPEPAVRRSALVWAEKRFETEANTGDGTASLRAACVRLAKDEDASVRLQLACTAAFLPEGARRDVLAELLSRDLDDPWIRRAVLLVGREDCRHLARGLLASGRGAASEVLFELGVLSASAGVEPGLWPPVPGPNGDSTASNRWAYLS